MTEISQAFARRAETLGFGRTRFHDLRGIHSTALLDAGIPVHRVAHRIGDDPATLLRNYTKRKRSKAADKNLSDAIAGVGGWIFGIVNRLGSQLGQRSQCVRLDRQLSH
jgi:integrase